MIKSFSWIIHVPYIGFIISSRFRSLFVRVMNRAFILSCVYRALLCIIVSMTTSTELCICALTQRITGMYIPTWMLQALFIRWYQWHTSCLERSKDYTGIDVSGEYMFLIMYKPMYWTNLRRIVQSSTYLHILCRNVKTPIQHLLDQRWNYTQCFVDFKTLLRITIEFDLHHWHSQSTQSILSLLYI